MTSAVRLIGVPSVPQAAPAPAPAAPPVWWSTDDVETHCGMTRNFVIDARESGALPAYRFGRVFRYRPADVAAWIESMRYQPGCVR